MPAVPGFFLQYLASMATRLVQLLVLLSFSTVAASADFFGMLRVRDLSPFGFLRLDIQPAHAITIDPGTWVIEAELGYQNSWALSPEVERYLVDLESWGRRSLASAEIAAIRALPGENYLVDLELGTLYTTIHYKISPHVSGYLVVGVVNYDGGFLDGTIENFHRDFGFDSFGREAIVRNEVNLIYDLKGAAVASVGTLPSDGGLLDPTIGVRYSRQGVDSRWLFSLEGAVKLALSGRRVLQSTGRSDYGIQVSAQYHGARHALYGNLATVYYAGNHFPVEQDSQALPTVMLGYEYALTERTHVNLQGYASESVYSRSQTDLDDLLADKFQLSAGLRHRVGTYVLTFGVTENLQNLNNTPDIGFQLGIAWIPGRSSRARLAP